jgi:hypothetical protein
MTAHLADPGSWAVIVALCVVMCTPVWLVSLWVRDRAVGRIERQFRDHMADLGAAPEKIDAKWREITGP